MLKQSTALSVLIYGVLLILSGYWGYHGAGSKISLYMGLAFGILSIISALLMFAHNNAGGYIALVLTPALGLIFAIRYYMTDKNFPAIMALISGALFLFLLLKMAHWRKN